MILVDKEIREEIAAGRIKVSPFDDTLINPASLDVRLGGEFTMTYPVSGEQAHFRDKSHYVIDPTDKTSFKTETFKRDSFVLAPGRTVLASMLEHTEVPDDISFKVMGKSSLARLGLDNSSQAGWAEAGWRGQITLELTNVAEYAIKLTKGMKIGQLVFFRHSSVGRSYKETGRYLDQTSAQGSLGI